MDNSISGSLTKAQHYLDLVVQFGATYAIKLFFALCIFIIGKRIARMISNLAVRAMQHKQVPNELTSFLDSFLYWGLFALVCITALAQLGIQTASFIAMLGAAGLAVGLALQGSLSNFAAGILILILRPFKVGDFVEMASASGEVKSIRIFMTELLTGDNKCVLIPNSRILESNITNYSSTGTRRVDLSFGVGYDDDIDLVRATIQQVIDAEPLILDEPKAVIAVNELADSSVNFTVRPWVKSKNYWPVYFSLTENMKKAFDKHNITIPYPQVVRHSSS